MSKVSVILPIYNAQPYLRQCLESIRNQTLTDIEVLCVNDGSTDDSPDVIREFAAADKRFVLVDKPNGGYGQALNFGIARATGEFIAIVEPDDFIHPEMLEQLCMFECYEGKPADIVKGSYWEFFDGRDGIPDQLDEPGLAEEMPKLPCVVDFAQDNTILLHHPSIWTAIYRRSFLEENAIRFVEPKGAGWADNPFFLETMIAAERIVWAPRAYYYYRQTNPGASSQLKDFRMPFERLDDMFAIARKRDADAPILAALYQRVFFYIESIVSEFGFDEADPELQQLIDQALSQMDPAVVYGSDNIRLEWITFYESRMALKTFLSNGGTQEEMRTSANETRTGTPGERPILTFIIPILNNAAHAAQSIASLLELPIDSFEALLVDCGATDRTRDICARAVAGDARFSTTENIGQALIAANSSYLYIHDLGDRFAGNAFARALLQAAEHGIDAMLLDARCRFAVEALCASGNVQPLDEWGEDEGKGVITMPFAPERAGSFALNCGRTSSHPGLYRTDLLKQAGLDLSPDDLICDRLFLARALAQAETVSYMAAPFVERPFEGIHAIPFFIDTRKWFISEKEPTLPRALKVLEDENARALFGVSSYNLVLEAFSADLRSRWTPETLRAYVDEHLENVANALESAPDELWFHDDEAYSDFCLLHQAGLEGFCTYHYLEQYRESEIRFKLLMDVEASRTYKLGQTMAKVLKGIAPTNIISQLRSSKAVERG